MLLSAGWLQNATSVNFSCRFFSFIVFFLCVCVCVTEEKKWNEENGLKRNKDHSGLDVADRVWSTEQRRGKKISNAKHKAALRIALYTRPKKVGKETKRKISSSRSARNMLWIGKIIRRIRRRNRIGSASTFLFCCVIWIFGFSLLFFFESRRGRSFGSHAAPGRKRMENGAGNW